MVDVDNTVFVSEGRLPCEQPFQRLLVTYEGKVGMCCFDWGAAHPVGYLKSEAYQNDDEYNKIIEKGKNKVKGYELLSNIKKSKVYNAPVEKIQTLYEIWHGEEINKVRKKHVLNKVEQVEICRNCSFKDTYEWIPVKSSSINYEL